MEERGLTGASSTAPVPLLPESERAGEASERRCPGLSSACRSLFRLLVSLPPSGLSSAFRSLFRLAVSLPPFHLSSAFRSLFRLPVSLPPSCLCPGAAYWPNQAAARRDSGFRRLQTSALRSTGRTGMWAVGAERHGRPNSTDPRSVT